MPAADGQADVFSLGVTLWEMLTMQKLFGGTTDFDTVNNVMTKQMKPPSAIRADVPPLLDRLVMQALERDIDKRPDARQLAQGLGDYLREARFLDDSVVELLRELFGEHTSRVVTLVPGDGADLGAGQPSRLGRCGDACAGARACDVRRRPRRRAGSARRRRHGRRKRPGAAAGRWWRWRWRGWRCWWRRTGARCGTWGACRGRRQTSPAAGAAAADRTAADRPGDGGDRLAAGGRGGRGLERGGGRARRR